MSTRATLIYRENPSLHIYQELLDNTVHVEIERAGVLVDIEIMSYEEWALLVLSKEPVHLPSAAEQGVQAGGAFRTDEEQNIDADLFP